MGKIRIKQIGTTLDDVKKGGAGSPRPQKKETLPRKGETAPPAKADAPEARAEQRVSPKKKTGKRLHPRRQHGRSQRYKKLAKAVVGAGSSHPLTEAIRLVQKTATANFPESIEAHIILTEPGVKATFTLPYSTGKELKILILTSDSPKLNQTLKALKIPNTLMLETAGAKKIAEIKTAGSPPDVDQIWATPDIMKEVAGIAKIIGPAGLMPNPKQGTVATLKDIPAKLKSLAAGKITLKTEREAPVIHTVLGKAAMKTEQLSENLEAILKNLPPKKLKRVTLSATMGPPLNVYLE